MNPIFLKNIVRKRVPFSHDEDSQLRALVKKYGDKNWQLIASNMPSRSVRQVRERWQLFLNSNITKTKWLPSEDEVLVQKYAEFGPQWKLLEKFFKGRTSYNIRNRWISLERARTRNRAPLINNHDKQQIHNNNVDPEIPTFENIDEYFENLDDQNKDAENFPNENEVGANKNENEEGFFMNMPQSNNDNPLSLENESPKCRCTFMGNPTDDKTMSDMCTFLESCINYYDDGNIYFPKFI